MRRIWLIDLAKRLPNATLHGYDISEAQFPHKNWVPGNVRLRQLDALSPIPEELVETYDVVHISLVVIIVRDDNPIPLLDNLLRMLSKFISRQASHPSYKAAAMRDRLSIGTCIADKRFTKQNQGGTSSGKKQIWKVSAGLQQVLKRHEPRVMRCTPH